MFLICLKSKSDTNEIVVRYIIMNLSFTLSRNEKVE